MYCLLTANKDPGDLSKGGKMMNIYWKTQKKIPEIKYCMTYLGLLYKTQKTTFLKGWQSDAEIVLRSDGRRN